MAISFSDYFKSIRTSSIGSKISSPADSFISSTVETIGTVSTNFTLVEFENIQKKLNKIFDKLLKNNESWLANNVDWIHIPKNQNILIILILINLIISIFFLSIKLFKKKEKSFSNQIRYKSNLLNKIPVLKIDTEEEIEDKQVSL